ncbi:MAG: UDP-N-acetylmuramoyl-tripeptide--D-alanyl-D-alanine ligase [marine bacterium B5-7]|nr:MAG: UDP-N-acetylmuramoyl-tripeptide--D-alanyl-D-alanine ligase [marine bacterium B5-7]
MIKFSLSEASTQLNARLHGDDAAFTGISIDTRSLQAGNLFFAVKGEHLDGHDFVQQAIDAGAAGLVVERVMDVACPQIIVDDALKAMGLLSKHWRMQFDFPVICLTGSNGKTTTKDLIASMLTAAFGADQVFATQGNFNNFYGVPLMLAQLGPQHRVAVIEIGMNLPGEIEYLVNLVQPDVAMITNVGVSHLAGVGHSIDGVAKEKVCIYHGLKEQGIAIINTDDDYADMFREHCKQHSQLTVGLRDGMVHADNIQLHPDHTCFTLMAPAGQCDINAPLMGLHNVRNALMAATACLAIGSDLAAIQQGLMNASITPGRLERKAGRNGAVIINDAYNANPLSLNAAITVLAVQPGRKILVLGDMGELGKDEVAFHQQAGETMRQAGIDDLLTLGTLTAHTAKVFGDKAKHFTDQATLIEAVLPLCQPDTTILIKGSCSMKMGNVVKACVTA